MLADARTGKNGRHALVGLLRQSVFGRLAGYEDVNDIKSVTKTIAAIVGMKAWMRGSGVAANGAATANAIQRRAWRGRSLRFDGLEGSEICYPMLPRARPDLHLGNELVALTYGAEP